MSGEDGKGTRTGRSNGRSLADLESLHRDPLPYQRLTKVLLSGVPLCPADPSFPPHSQSAVFKGLLIAQSPIQKKKEKGHHMKRPPLPHNFTTLVLYQIRALTERKAVTEGRADRRGPLHTTRVAPRGPDVFTGHLPISTCDTLSDTHSATFLSGVVHTPHRRPLGLSVFGVRRGDGPPRSSLKPSFTGKPFF